MLGNVIRVFIVLLIPILVGFAVYKGLKSFFFEPAVPGSIQEFLVEVKPGSSFRSFCQELQEKGIIKNWRILDIISQVKKSDTQVKAGEYKLSPAMSPQEIIKKLSDGDVFKRIVTIKEGMDIWDVASAVDLAEVVSDDEFLVAVRKPDIIERFEIQAVSLEGYLFPETYYFSGKQGVVDVIWRMVDQFYGRWDESYNRRLQELGFTMQEILTLASIIEKESGNAKEQSLISSVFHNRLRNGMKLESDPTLVYGIKDYGGEVLNKHKEIDSPYNTYKNFGLPPGPICNPGEDAINAALYPEESEYLFFVADGNGGHRFSATLREHNEAVRQYRALMQQKKLEQGEEVRNEEEYIGDIEPAPAQIQ